MISIQRNASCFVLMTIAFLMMPFNSFATDPAIEVKTNGKTYINKALNLIPQETAPVDPEPGDLYYNTSGGLFVYQDSQWREVVVKFEVQFQRSYLVTQFVQCLELKSLVCAHRFPHDGVEAGRPIFVRRSGLGFGCV